jgi:hypothetical protein
MRNLLAKTSVAQNLDDCRLTGSLHFPRNSRLIRRESWRKSRHRRRFTRASSLELYIFGPETEAAPRRSVTILWVALINAHIHNATVE